MIQSNPWPLVDLLDSGNRKKKQFTDGLPRHCLNMLIYYGKYPAMRRRSVEQPHGAAGSPHIPVGRLNLHILLAQLFLSGNSKDISGTRPAALKSWDCQNAHHVCAILGSNRTRECFTMFHHGNPGKFATSNVTEPARLRRGENVINHRGAQISTSFGQWTLTTSICKGNKHEKSSS